MQSAEIIINSCYGGFSFSDKAIEEYKKQLQAMGSNIVFGDNKKYRREDDLRKDPVMIDIVRRLGKESYGSHAKLINEHRKQLTYNQNKGKNFSLLDMAFAVGDCTLNIKTGEAAIDPDVVITGPLFVIVKLLVLLSLIVLDWHERYTVFARVVNGVVDGVKGVDV